MLAPMIDAVGGVGPDVRPTVLVAVPAHDESERVVSCLASVHAALRFAEQAGTIADGFVAVAAHRCRDATATLAGQFLAEVDRRHVVWVAAETASVGAVRTALIARAVRSAGESPTWLFSTDADTQVPLTWVTDGLRLASDDAADLVLGLVELNELAVDAPARLAHDRLVAGGLRPGGGHDHVYAANLLVRYAAYLAVGGFPDVRHGEEHGLRTAVRAAGYRVLSTRALVVRTSGRMEGRASFGLHAVLAALAATPQPEDSGSPFDRAVVDG
ncbi:MAG: glycosyltransferase [Propionibacteriaceae bacterium]